MRLTLFFVSKQKYLLLLSLLLVNIASAQTSQTIKVMGWEISADQIFYELSTTDKTFSDLVACGDVKFNCGSISGTCGILQYNKTSDSFIVKGSGIIREGGASFKVAPLEKAVISTSGRKFTIVGPGKIFLGEKRAPLLKSFPRVDGERR